MQIRHLAIAALLVSASAAHAEAIRPHAGTLTGWAVQGKVVGASTDAAVSAVLVPVPAAAVAPVVSADPINVTAAVVAVPEPSSIALLLAGVMGVGALRRRRK